jgi:hypothetical protein
VVSDGHSVCQPSLCRLQAGLYFLRCGGLDFGLLGLLLLSPRTSTARQLAARCAQRDASQWLEPRYDKGLELSRRIHRHGSVQSEMAPRISYVLGIGIQGCFLWTSGRSKQNRLQV